MRRKAPAWRSMGRYGDGPWIVNLGPRSPFVADPSEAPPRTFADLYTATATGEPPDIRVMVTDRATGATARAARGEDVTLSVTVADVLRLERDARAILGIAQVGRPPEQADRVATYQTAIEALRDGGWQESRITARIVLGRLDRTGNESQLRDDIRGLGGWRAFRAKVYGGE
jgi:hypothetical protein